MSIVKLVNGKKEIISKNDLAAIIKMMKGNLESFSKFALSINDDDPKSKLIFSEDEKGDLRKQASEIYLEAADKIEKKYTDLYNNEEEVNLEELLKNEVLNIEKTIFDKRGKQDPYAVALIKASVAGYNNEYLYHFVENESKFGDFKEMDISTDENYKVTAGNFSLSQIPYDGISDIVYFDPMIDTVISMSDERKKNSTTLSYEADEEEIQDQEELVRRMEEKYEKLKQSSPNDKAALQARKEKNDVAKKELNRMKYGSFAFNSAAEAARAHSVKLMDKKEVTVEDLFDAFSNINEYIRMGQGEGGKIRGHQVSFGMLAGVEPGKAVLFLYRMLDTIAEKINFVKKEADPDLKRTHAIEIASFTYQMAITEHVFEDGNGRSCRLFADTILQSFGLPPHIPSEEEMDLSRGMGKKLDFNKGALEIFEGVKQASQQVKKDRAVLEKKQEETRRSDLERKKIQNDIRRREKINKISDELVKQLKNDTKQAYALRGNFHNSDKYDIFEALLVAKYEFAKLINDAKKNELNKNKTEGYKMHPVSLASLSKNTKKLFTLIESSEPNMKNVDLKELNQANLDLKNPDLNRCLKLYLNVDQTIEIAARQYIQYKYEDHTDDTSLEPDKKALNTKDKKKLDFIAGILPEGRAMKMKEEYLNSTGRGKGQMQTVDVDAEAPGLALRGGGVKKEQDIVTKYPDK